MSNRQVCLLQFDITSSSSSLCRKNQQYDSKWYIPLTELTFQGPEDTEPLHVPQVPDEELDAMRVKISHLRSELQREKVVWIHCFTKISLETEKRGVSHSRVFSPDFREPTRVQRSSTVLGRSCVSRSLCCC